MNYFHWVVSKGDLAYHISPPPYTWGCLDIFSKWVVSRKASLDPSGFLPVKNESQTVLTVSLSPDDEAPLTRAILCSPCEEHEEQKRQFDLHLVRLILTQLRCIGSVCARHTYGSSLEIAWGLQEGRTRNLREEWSAWLKRSSKSFIVFTKRRKGSKLRAYDSDATNRECCHIYNIAMEIMYYY